MSWNIWNRPSGSFMVDMGISSNIMKYPFPKCYMTFWDMTMYVMTPSIDQALHQFAHLLPNWTLLPILTLLPNFGGFHRTLKRVRLANRGHLLLRTPGPVPFGTCICSKQKRSTEGCSKFKSPETRQVQERLVSTLEHMQVPKWDRTRCPEE